MPLLSALGRLTQSVKRITLSQRDGLWILIAYGAVVGFLLLRHDMWRDEAQLWLVSKASSTPWGLLQDTSYETRPLSWFLICWFVSRFTSNIEALKIVNWLLSMAAAWTAIFLLPLRRELHVLFLSGFFVLVGYASISEDYMLGTFLLVLCTAAVVNKWSFGTQCLLLAGLANVHFLFFLIAVSGLGILTLTRMWTHYRREYQWTSGDLISCGAAWALTAFSYVLIRPHADFAYRPRLVLSTQKIPQGFHAVVTSIFPWIDKTPTQYIIEDYGFLAEKIAIVVVLLVIGLAWYRHVLLGLHATISCGLLIGYFTFGNYFYWWHLGVLALNVIMILIMVSLIEPRQRSSDPRIQLGAVLLLTFVLLMQSYASYAHPGRDMWGQRPYSNAKNAAEFIKVRCGSDCTVVADQEMYVSPVVAYLDREMFFVDAGRIGTYTQWKTTLRLAIDWPYVISAARQFPKSIILTVGLWRSAPPGVSLLANFYGAVWGEENYQIWQLD